MDLPGAALHERRPAGWGSDLFPPVDVCAAHLDELAAGALALHTNRGRDLIVRPLHRGAI